MERAASRPGFFGPNQTFFLKKKIPLPPLHHLKFPFPHSTKPLYNILPLPRKKLLSLRVLIYYCVFLYTL